MASSDPRGEEKTQEVQKVTLDDVLREISMPSAYEVGPLTRIGYKLALFLLLYLSVVTVALLVDYFVNAPPFPGALLLTKCSSTSTSNSPRSLQSGR